MKRILLTGVAGMIGSHLADELVRKNYAVTGVDNLSVGKMENIKDIIGSPNFHFHKGDVLNLDFMREVAVGSDVIIHLASSKKIGESGSGIDILKINTKCTENVLEISHEIGCKVIFGSTSDLYGISEDIPFREDGNLLLGPSTIKRWTYAVSKFYGEHLFFAYYKEKSVPIVVLRYFGGFSHRSSFSWSGGHVPLFMDAIMNGGEIIIHGDGKQTRSMGYVSDLVDGTILAMERENAIGEIINIGNDEEISVLDSAYIIRDVIEEVTGVKKELDVKFKPYEEMFGGYKDVMRRIPDLTKAKKILGYNPKISFREAVKKTFANKL